MADNKIVSAGTVENMSEYSNPAYDILVKNIRNHVEETLKRLKEENGKPTRLFVANPTKLYTQYLDSFEDVGERKHYTCSTCGAFFRHYGSIVYVKDNGKMESLIWNPECAPDKFKSIIKQLKESVESSYIIGLAKFNIELRHLDSVVVGGTESCGGFNHFHIRFGRSLIANNYDETYAESWEFYRVAEKLLTGYSDETWRHAIALASTGDLNKEDAKEIIENMSKLVTRVSNASKSKRRTNLIWRLGYENKAFICNFNNSVYNRLLDNFKDGCDYAYVTEDFNRMVDPINYKRPTAAPTSGQVKTAEEIVEKLGLKDSLKRTLLKLEDLPESGIIWREPSNNKAEEPTGVFANVATKDKKRDSKHDKPVATTPEYISFTKFVDTVLPGAVSITVSDADYNKAGKMPFIQFVTAAVKDAPPILKYDKLEARNPISVYAYYGGSFPAQFNVSPFEEFDVVAIVAHPEKLLSGDCKNGVEIILRKCYDKNYTKCGSALFPDNLIPELYDSRKVIEQYSNNTNMEPVDTSEQFVAGLPLSFKGNQVLTLKVESGTCCKQYKIATYD